jgi:hypothetical protein
VEAALGAKFEVLFQKLFVKVSHFVIFRNLFDFLDVTPAASKVTIQIRGLLQMPAFVLKFARHGRLLIIKYGRWSLPFSFGGLAPSGKCMKKPGWATWG